MLNTKRALCLFATTFASLALLGQGCAPASRVTPPASSEPKPPTTAAPTETATTIVTEQKNSTYEPFTKAKYDEARATGKPIFLFFYANFCPTCREQDPRLMKIVPTHEGGVIGLRVNFNDTETDADEKALAKEFGVTYQHTGFFIGRDGATKKKTIGTISNAQTVEYLNLISN